MTMFQKHQDNPDQNLGEFSFAYRSLPYDVVQLVATKLVIIFRNRR